MNRRRAIITITEHNGSFLYSFEAGSLSKTRYRAGLDASSAAAKAMELAISHGDQRGYVIFAPKQVLDLIPVDLRSREATA